jgi:hypothetical protein
MSLCMKIFNNSYHRQLNKHTSISLQSSIVIIYRNGRPSLILVINSYSDDTRDIPVLKYNDQVCIQQHTCVYIVDHQLDVEISRRGGSHKINIIHGPQTFSRLPFLSALRKIHSLGTPPTYDNKTSLMLYGLSKVVDGDNPNIINRGCHLAKLIASFL